MPGAILAFSGKGGSGKTTLAALVLRELTRRGLKPVLAVDADPNATLAIALGVPSAGTIAELRDNMGAAAQNPSEIPKDRLMDQWLAELLSEQQGFDLLTMGRPEGPKCYCYVNGLLRRYLKLLRNNYPYVVVDCEAGMEHLSRLTVDDVHTLIIVAEATHVGLRTAGRIAALADSLPIHVERRVLALNKVSAEGPAAEIDRRQAGLPGVATAVQVPFDGDLANRWARGEAIDAGPAVRAAVEELTSICLELAPQKAKQAHKETA